MFRPVPYPPLPQRQKRGASASTILVGCPRFCPQWQRTAYLALTKPKPFRREAIAHRDPAQMWPDDANALIDRMLKIIMDEMELSPPRVHRDSAGDFHLVMEFSIDQTDGAKAVAVALSKLFEDRWFSVGALHVLNGRFYRPKNPFNPTLFPASAVHLRRDWRLTVSRLLRKLQTHASEVTG